MTSSGPAPARWLRGVALGLLAATGVWTLRQVGALDGIFAVVLAALLLSLLPTARTLSARWFINGAVFFGWVQCLWWLPLGGAMPWRASVLLAAASAVVVTVAVVRPRLIRPRVGLTDGVPPLIVALAAWWYAPSLRVRSGLDGLTYLMGAWDNVAHFGMVRQILAFGGTADAVGFLSSGDRPAYAHYPQAFHALTATLMELRAVGQTQVLSVQLVLYTQTSTLVILSLAGIIAAGMCMLPVARRRPSWALALGAAAAGPLTVGSGFVFALDGFHNFLFACGMVVVTAISASVPRAINRPMVVAVVAGGIVGVAHSWILLTPLALLAALPLLRIRSMRAGTPGRLAVSVLILATGAVAAVRSIPIVSHVAAEDPLTLTGGIHPTSLGEAIIATLALAALALLSVDRRPRSIHRVPATALVSLAAGSVVMVVVIVTYQISQADMLTYYSMKVWSGVAIIMMSLLPLPVAWVLRRVPRTPPMTAVAIVVALTVSQSAGYLGPPLGSRPSQPEIFVSPLMEFDAIADERHHENSAAAHLAVSAALMQQDDPDHFLLLVVPPPTALESIMLTNQWVRSLGMTWAQRTQATMLDGTADRMDTDTPLSIYVAEVLTHTPPLTPVVIPEDATAAVRGLSAGDRARVRVLQPRAIEEMDLVRSLEWPR